MQETCKTKILSNVEVQENGIIRNEHGLIIGRLSKDVRFDSAQLSTPDDGVSVTDHKMIEALLEEFEQHIRAVATSDPMPLASKYQMEAHATKERIIHAFIELQSKKEAFEGYKRELFAENGKACGEIQRLRNAIKALVTDPEAVAEHLNPPADDEDYTEGDDKQEE